MITMIAAIIIVVALLSAVSYSETKKNFETNHKLSTENAEQHLSDSIILIANGLRLFELTYDGELRRAFLPFLDAYNASQKEPSTINLEEIRQKLPPSIASRLDLYIIDENGIVINATYTPDIGLDFRQWPSVYEDITSIRLGNEFRSDRAVIGFKPETDIRKFAYLPTPDHQYLLELSIRVNEYTQERSKFSFLSVAKAISQKYPDIRSVSLYDTMSRLITANGTQGTDAEPETQNIIKTVFATHKPVSIPDPDNLTDLRYIFIGSGGNETVSDNMYDIVARINYNTSSYENEKRSTLQYHLLMALLSALSGILLVFILTRHLTGQINLLIEDVDQIAQGNLDHKIHPTGSPEVTRLAKSLTLMVHSLKSLISTLREKEIRLRESEERYRSMIENQTDLIMRFDHDGNIRYVNDIFCSYFQVENVLGTSLFDLVSEDIWNELQERIRLLTSSTPVSVLEHQIILEEGSEKWILWSISAIFDLENRIIEYQAVGRDISQIKTTEKALSESEEKYRTLITNLPDYVIVHQNNRIIFANESISRELGYQNISLIGTPIYDYILEEDLTQMYENIKKRINGEKVDDYEIHVRTGTNEIRTVIVRASPISYNNSPALLAVLTDITERKRAEQNFQEGEQRYRRLIEQLNEGIWITDQNAITVFTNTKMEELLHYEKEELLGKSYFFFVSPEKLSYVMDKMINRRTGFSDRYPMTFITKDGFRIYTEVSVTPTYNPQGHYTGSLALISDITERKLNEEQIEQYTRELEQKNRELESLRDQLFIVNENLDRFVHKRTEQVMSLLRQKDEFIMQLGHDLRTPLTPIIGLLPDLIEEENKDYSHHALMIIEQNVRYIHDIANKSLKLAKMNSFTIKPEVEPIRIGEEVTHILMVHERDLQAAGISTRVTIPDELVIGADKVLFQELIANIISNAIKYIQRSDGRITITGEENDKMVMIRIEDNGIGLRADETEKIFEEFYKSDRSRHDKSSTGLGLAICRKIVENHGGIIRAESPGPGEGTSFLIMLPKWNDKDEVKDRS